MCPGLVWDPRIGNNCVHHCTWFYTIKGFLRPHGPIFNTKLTLKVLCDIVRMIDDYRRWNSRYLYQNALIRACPNCDSQIQVRKLARPCGTNFLHILSYVLWLRINTYHALRVKHFSALHYFSILCELRYHWSKFRTIPLIIWTSPLSGKNC